MKAVTDSVGATLSGIQHLARMEQGGVRYVTVLFLGMYTAGVADLLLVMAERGAFDARMYAQAVSESASHMHACWPPITSLPTGVSLLEPQTSRGQPAAHHRFRACRTWMHCSNCTMRCNLYFEPLHMLTCMVCIGWVGTDPCNKTSYAASKHSGV